MKLCVEGLRLGELAHRGPITLKELLTFGSQCVLLPRVFSIDDMLEALLQLELGETLDYRFAFTGGDRCELLVQTGTRA